MFVTSRNSASQNGKYGFIEKFDTPFNHHLFPENAVICKVLVIYTGGTIGMVRNSREVLVPVQNVLKEAMLRDPQLHDQEYFSSSEHKSDLKELLVLPQVEGMRRVLYHVLEYETLLDSSNMTMDHWSIISNDIYKNYESYDGFVILHGTDTLAYTASALSFMLENLGKSVILTGAQIPIFEPRSDGKDNFISSLLLAGNYNIPEVTVFFNHKLFRGNRTMKSSTDNFAAFESYNVPPLAIVGIKFEVDFRAILRPSAVAKFSVHSHLNKNVGLLRIFPSISQEIVKAFLQPPIEGVVMQTYGAGNMPSNRQDLVKEMKEATERGVIIVNCTQCLTGSVNHIYETGKVFLDAGVISGGDMTPESALTKLSYVLSKDEWDISTKRLMMSNSLRGELTISKALSNGQEVDLIEAVAQSLHLTAPHELKKLNSILFPAMFSAAVIEENFNKLSDLMSYGADINAFNADLRTPLHIACCQSHLEVVRYLLIHGASVHMKDRYGQTPLMDAIWYDRHEVIELLRSNGAHLHITSTELGNNLCSAAARGQIKRIKSFELAGADLRSRDISGRTPLHEAVLHKQLNIVHYLLEAKVPADTKDDLGMTPFDIAKQKQFDDIIRILLLYINSTKII